MARRFFGALRRAEEMTQQELADRIGTDQIRISQLERGIREPTTEQRKAIAAVFPDVSEDALFSMVIYGENGVRLSP